MVWAVDDGVGMVAYVLRYGLSATYPSRLTRHPDKAKILELQKTKLRSVQWVKRHAGSKGSSQWKKLPVHTSQ